MNKTKVSELEGAPHLQYVLCACGGVWDLPNGPRERREFFAKHKDHNVETFTVRTRCLYRSTEKRARYVPSDCKWCVHGGDKKDHCVQYRDYLKSQELEK